MSAKCVSFGFAIAPQSTSASFRFFKISKWVDMVNIRGKPAKKRSTSPIFSIHVDNYALYHPVAFLQVYIYDISLNVRLSFIFLLLCFRLLRSEHEILPVLEVGRTSPAGSHPVQTGSSPSRGTTFTMVAWITSFFEHYLHFCTS